MIEAIEGYRCDKCKDSTSEKHRKLFISYAPDIITIQLKRTDEYGRKLNTAITINRFLDLSRYRDAGNQETLRYELSAVIKHQGSSGFGHYICSAKGPNGDWYGFDDQRKTVTSFTAAVSSTGDFTPYLLFFQRKED
jgi:ubiquitin C-terminal hydrolase